MNSERLRYRLRSPLRWLCATMSAMFLFATVGVLDALYLLPVPPIVAGLFLLAPPLGPYAHAEQAPARTTAQVLLRRGATTEVPNGSIWTLRVENTGRAMAEGFRVRLTIPTDLAPAAAQGRLLHRTTVGAPGTHWFIETGWEHAIVTLRAGAPDTADAIRIAPGEGVDLGDLLLPSGASGEVGFQINGGSVKTALGSINLPG